MLGTLTANDIQRRLGKLTASNMWRAMDFLKSGKESAERKKYKTELVAERLTGVFVPHYVNRAMEHGIAFEPEARSVYTQRTGRKIIASQFLDHSEIDLCGATPDGFVDDGLIEIKCPETTTFIKWALAGEVPDEHIPQMALQMDVTGRDWVDFVAYDPRIPSGRNMLIIRYERSKAYQKEVRKMAKLFLAEVEEMFRIMTEGPWS